MPDLDAISNPFADLRASALCSLVSADVGTVDARVRHVALAGGKSGGHVFPALALAAELRGRGWRVSFVGTEEGMEKRLATSHEIDFYSIPARPLVGRRPVQRLGALVTLARSSWRARRLIKSLAVDAVVGTGGYVSAPAVLAARSLGLPVMLLEPNRQPGFANRWLSRFAAEVATAYADTGAELACSATVTGVPVRAEFSAIDVPPAAERGVGVLVVGGSQGARKLNLALPRVFQLIVGRRPAASPPIRVVHQTGRQLLAETEQRYEAVFGPAKHQRYRAPGLEVELCDFIDDMIGALSGVHLVVSRAGAVTLAELSAAGRASVLVPLTLAGGHQSDNAEAMAELGAAIVVQESELMGEDVDQVVDRLAALLGDPEELARMGARARSTRQVDARVAIADRLEALTGGGAAP